MGSKLDTSSRICPVPPGSKRTGYRHLEPWTIIMTVGLVTILSTSAISTYAIASLPLIGSESPYGLQFGPFHNVTNPIRHNPLFPISYIPNPDTLVYSTDGWIHSLEPALDTGNSIDTMIVSNCYDTLVSYDGESVNSFRPLLVTEVPSLENGRISPDGLTYRFTIRSNSPLTPEDVEYSFERAMVRGLWGHTGLLRESLLGINRVQECCGNDTILVSFEDIDSAVEVEGNDVVFHLVRKYPPFMHILASRFSSILSKAWCIEAGDWPGTEETWVSYVHPNSPFDTAIYPLDSATQGYGPFMLKSRTDKEIVLVRNALYWRGPARLKRVAIRVTDDWEGAEWETRKQMFLEGDADICTVPEEIYAELEGVEGIQVYKGLPTLQCRSLYFNLAVANDSSYIGSGKLDGYGVPPDFFSDIDIRKAFAYSVDYDTIINEIYTGEAQQPSSPVPEGVPFHNPEQECYTYDLDMARQHFQQAWGGEVWNKGFNVTLVFQGISPMGNHWAPRKQAIAETIKNSIEAINTNFQVNVQPQYGVAWSPTPFCIDDGYPDWACFDGFATVFQGHNDSTIDSLIEAGMNTLDPAERQAIYYELQRVYHEEVPGIPLVQPLTRHYQRDWVQGWYYNPATGMDFYMMSKFTCQGVTRGIMAYLADLVDSEILGADSRNSLIKIIECAIYLMDGGNPIGASQKLSDFIYQVNALELPVEHEEELVAMAQEIQKTLARSYVTFEDLLRFLLIGTSGITAMAIIVLFNHDREIYRMEKGPSSMASGRRRRENSL